MKGYFAKYGYYFFLFLTLLLIQSCKTDEFKFNEITIKDDFDIKIITPLFTGKDKEGNILEFRDFIQDWKKPINDNTGPYTVLKYSDIKYKTIPTRSIFDRSIIIDSLHFLIQGSYDLSNVELVFTVSNSCPFPLNLMLQFINSSTYNVAPPILPPAFLEADFNQKPVIPVTTIHNVKLDSLQMLSFTNSKKIKLTSWYDQTNFINQNDTVSAHYPIDVSIVLIGKVHAKQ